MPASKKVRYPVPDIDLKHQEVFLHIWHVPFLRNIFFACLAAAIFFPVLKWSYLSPSYSKMLTTVNEQNAQRTAAYFLRILNVTPKECWHCGGCRINCPCGAVHYEFPLSMLI